MTRFERKLFRNTLILGGLLTILAGALDSTGIFGQFEQFAYDQRLKRCQYYQPAPTNKLVHIDIDDPSLESIGAWPWPREKMAQIVDEIRLAGAKALAFDVIYSEPQDPRYVPVERSQLSAKPTTQPVPTQRVDDDRIFAEALRKFGKAAVPLSLNLAQQSVVNGMFSQMVLELTKNPEQGKQDLLDLLEQNRHLSPSVKMAVLNDFQNARKEAVYNLISANITSHPESEDLRLTILPGAKSRPRGEPVDKVFEEQYRRYNAILSLRRFSRPIPEGLPPLLTTKDEQATVYALSNAAGASGYVDYLPLGDGVVRMVPLLANHRDFLFPQLGLSLAMTMLDVEFKDLKIKPDRIIIPRPDGKDIQIPVHNQNTQLGSYGMFFDVPWFGDWKYTNAWISMYDYPNHTQPAQHISISYIYDIVGTREKIRNNNAGLREAVIFMYAAFVDEKKAREIEAMTYDPEDPMVFVDLAKKGFEKFTKDDILNGIILPIDANDPDPEIRTLRKKGVALPDGIKNYIEQAGKLQADLTGRRTDLNAILEGKAGLIGWISVGALADYVPTSLHPRCPGVVVHGAIYNAIMTNNFLWRKPYWVTFCIAMFLGLVATVLVSWFSSWKSIIMCMVLAIGYVLFNGIYLFDHNKVIVGMAGPLFCIGLVWAGGTLGRYIEEIGERARVRKSLSVYIDPKLVDYVLEHGPESLNGRQKEISVVFTDLQGFTTISEKLQEKAIPILNDYMGLMIPIIRKHQGYLNKLLGDGIMYFFNAPYDNEDHPRLAVRSALEMQSVMPAFNESLAKLNLPPLMMRMGLSTCDVIVGNAGPSDHSFNDYTALGDPVNLCSRLEGANKAFGTKILVNEMIRDRGGDDVLYRPVGIIQVVGKSQGIATFEAMCWKDKATDDQKFVAEETQKFVDAFIKGEFEKTLEIIKTLDEKYGQTKLTRLYASVCRNYMETPPERFLGQISLSEK